MEPFNNFAVQQVFEQYPDPFRHKLLTIRDLVFETAAIEKQIGTIEETLKWGEPAYLTSETGSGSTIRLAWHQKTPNQCGIYFNCQTTLVPHFRAIFPDELNFEGNRAIVFGINDAIPIDRLQFCVFAALTYHLHNFRDSPLMP
jgi:hypothetical protein